MTPLDSGTGEWLPQKAAVLESGRKGKEEEQKDKWSEVELAVTRAGK